MTSNHTARLYALVGTVVGLFLAWVAISTHPWKATPAANAGDPRLVALQQREQLLRRDIALVQKIATRAAATRSASSLAAVRTPAATPTPVQAAPRVRVVTLPPLVVTRTS